MRTEQLTKYCEPLQKMRFRLAPCKIDLNPSPSNFILMIVPMRLFCCGSVLCCGVEFLCCLKIVYVFIDLVKFG